jgi:hypothetical protein
VTLSNTGNASLTISSIAISGDFAQTNTCGATLAASSSCTLSVTFTPTASGSRTGTLSITDNASGSPQNVSLSGTGVTPGQLVATPSTVSFGSVVTGQSSTQTVSVSNTGGASLTISSASTSGPFSISGLSTPLILAANQSSSFSIAFEPSNSGSATGSVNLTNSGTGSPTVISLTGTGTAPVAHQVDLSWTASTSSDVVGYDVYRGTTSGGPYTEISSATIAVTAFTDTDVSAGTTYFYVVTAVDGSGLQSAYSNQVTAVVPTP